MDMIDIFKEVMQDGMEIVKCKEMSNKYKITLSYNGMNATCELNKLCTPGNEKSLCMRAIDTAMSTMYIDNGNYQEAKAWLDGERWNEKKESKFKKPEAPFLLLAEDMDGIVSYYWWDNKKKMQEDAVEGRGNGERIVCAIEISSCRDVEIP